MLVTHRSDCPALCADHDTTHTHPVGGGHYSTDHACTCSAPTGEQLRELVEAAHEASADVVDNELAARLDAALEPWRAFIKGPRA